MKAILVTRSPSGRKHKTEDTLAYAGFQRVSEVDSLCVSVRISDAISLCLSEEAATKLATQILISVGKSMEWHREFKEMHGKEAVKF